MYRRKPNRDPKRSLMRVRNLWSVVNKVIVKKLDVKTIIYSTSDGNEILHNNFMTPESGVTLVDTAQGI